VGSSACFSLPQRACVCPDSLCACAPMSQRLHPPAPLFPCLPLCLTPGLLLLFLPSASPGFTLSRPYFLPLAPLPMSLPILSPPYQRVSWWQGLGPHLRSLLEAMTRSQSRTLCFFRNFFVKYLRYLHRKDIFFSFQCNQGDSL
jgi:hypothetical protein